MEEGPRKLKAIGSVPEVVYNILKQNGTPMHHKEITDRIIQMLPDVTQPDPKLIARIHTDINLDNRFYHMGNGMWGLKEWAPKQKIQQRVIPTWQPRTTATKPRRSDLWRDEEEFEDHNKLDEDETDWPRDNDEDPERPEAW